MSVKMIKHQLFLKCSETGDDHNCETCHLRTHCEDQAWETEMERLGSFLEPFLTGVNRSDILPDELAHAVAQKHRYLQNEFIILMLRTLKAYSELDPNLYVDGRNEPAHRILQSIFKLIKNNPDGIYI